MTAGDIYTVAGDGTAGYAGDGAAASGAELDEPESVAVDAHGNVVVADYGNNRVRLVAEESGTAYGLPVVAGDIYTVAGTGSPQFSGDGGPAVDSRPLLAPGRGGRRHGNIVVADSGNNRVRVIAASTGTDYGQSVAADDIETVAGTGALGGFSGDGGPCPPMPSSTSHRSCRRRSGRRGGGRPEQQSRTVRTRGIPGRTSARRWWGATSTRWPETGPPGPARTEPVARAPRSTPPPGWHSMRREICSSPSSPETGSGWWPTPPGTFYGRSMTAGSIYTIAGTGAIGSTGDGRPASRAEVNAPENLAVDGSGNVVFTEFYGNRVRVIAGSHRHLLRALDDRRRHLHRRRHRCSGRHRRWGARP